MLATKQCLPLLLGALAINAAASALPFDPDWPPGAPLPLLLLKRQDDNMSEAEYNCHDNCGQAILAARASGTAGPCTDAAFLHDYAACLQCAGPANEDIWQYYGGALTAVAAACSGLSTVPATAVEPAVSAAVTATATSGVTATATATASASGASGGASASGGGGAASSAGGSAAATASATSTAAVAAPSSASSAAAASSASAAGAASGARFGCVSMLGSLSALGYFVLGF